MWKEDHDNFAALLAIHFEYAAKAVYAEHLAEHAMFNLLGRCLDDATTAQLIGKGCPDDGPANSNEILAAFAANRDHAERFATVTISLHRF